MYSSRSSQAAAAGLRFRGACFHGVAPRAPLKRAVGVPRRSACFGLLLELACTRRHELAAQDVDEWAADDHPENAAELEVEHARAGFVDDAAVHEIPALPSDEEVKAIAAEQEAGGALDDETSEAEGETPAADESKEG